MNISILGFGSIGQRHYSNLSSLGHLLRAYDPSTDNPETRAKVIDWADAVVIASPTSCHYEDIKDCATANKPMFVEKPLIAEASPVDDDTLGLIRMVGYNLRFHSCVRRARELLGDGQIGKPLWARFTCAQLSMVPGYLRDGVILNWSHEIDLAVHLLGVGTVRCAAAVRAAGPIVAESLADIVLLHDVTGCQSVVHLDYLTHPENRGFTIVGTTGLIECDLVKRELLIRDQTGLCTEFFRGHDTFDTNYVLEMKAFIERLSGKKTPGCTASEALHVANLCLRAKELINER